MIIIIVNIIIILHQQSLWFSMELLKAQVCMMVFNTTLFKWCFNLYKALNKCHTKWTQQTNLRAVSRRDI